MDDHRGARRRARFNIDSIHILSSYLKDNSLRQGIIARMDTIVDQYNATVATLPDDEAAANEAAEGAPGEEAGVTKQVLEQSIQDTKAQIDLLKSSGFPIGPAYFPHGCRGEDTADCTARNNAGGWFWWIIGILLTTGLAGLGAPFWYDAIRGISSLAQQAGKSGKAAQK